MTPQKCENCGNDMEPGTFKEWTCYHCFYYIDNEAPEDKKDCVKVTDYPCVFCGYNDETCSMCGKCDNYSCFVDRTKDAEVQALEAIRNRDILPSDPLRVTLRVKDRLFNEERPAATPEPMSKAGVDDVLPELIKDLEARTSVGVKSYGKPLQTHIGRDPLMDAYQECLDQAQYLKQEIMEREKPFSECIADWANARRLYDTATPYSQMKKMFEELLEWFDEVKSGDQEAEQIELGDCLVVLQNIANMRNYDLDSCGWLAYHKIKNRPGKTIDGTFVKD